MNNSNFIALEHVSVLVADVKKSLHFYIDILGFSLNTKRPPLPYDGAWLNVGRQQIHLIQQPNPDPVSGRPEHPGRDRHLAVQVRDIGEIHAALKQRDIPVSFSKSGRKALFCRDPDGNGIEFIELSE